MRIAVVAFSSLAHDSRVLRCAAALQEAGHEVLLVGHAPSPPAPPCRIALLPERPSPLLIRAGIVLRQAPATLLSATAEPLYWLDAARRRAREILHAFRPDAVHANDWNTLPLAVDLKRRTGARIVYDSHEMALAEFEERLVWRLAALAHVRAIEAAGMRRADAVVTVSPGIARALKEAYPAAPDPVVVRNTPDAAPATFRPTGEAVRVLFHGHLRPNRGLEPLVASLPLWRDGVRLVLRGGGAPSYVEGLRRLAGTGDRLEIVPPVPPDAVVAAASAADLGAVLLPDTSRHNRFALPNKLFEYLSAGLAVMISDVPDMAEIVRAWECGLVSEPAPQAIAAAVNALDRPGLDRMKRRALEAAAALAWPRERATLLRVYDTLASAPPRA